MRLLVNNALIYDSQAAAFKSGQLAIANGLILPGSLDGMEFDKTIDAGGAYLVPGLVDIHTHGRAGCDFCDADATGMKTMKTAYLKTGVTTVMPTLASAPFDDLLAAAERIEAARKLPGARFLGIHLEGRYLNPAKRGVQSEKLLAKPDTGELEELIARMGLPFHITFAPELDTDGTFLTRVLSLGATAAAGHTGMTYAEAVLAESRGITAYSHLFNAMPPLHHRAGGAVAAALTGVAYCELICDGMHISPEMIRLAYRCAGNSRCVLVSDSMEAAGCQDGNYMIAGVPVKVKDGKALSADGALGGSTLNLFDGLMNIMKFCSISLEEALPCATINPARAVGIDNLVGSLEPGKFADALIFRDDRKGSYRIEGIISGGEPVIL